MGATLTPPGPGWHDPAEREMDRNGTPERARGAVRLVIREGRALAEAYAADTETDLDEHWRRRFDETLAPLGATLILLGAAGWSEMARLIKAVACDSLTHGRQAWADPDIYEEG